MYMRTICLFMCLGLQVNALPAPQDTGNSTVPLDITVNEVSKPSNSNISSTEVETAESTKSETPSSNETELVKPKHKLPPPVDNKETSFEEEDPDFDPEEYYDDEFFSSDPPEVLSTVTVHDHTMKVLQEHSDKDNTTRRICQELWGKVNLVTEKCILIKRNDPSNNDTEVVEVTTKPIHGENFTCQEVVNTEDGPIQEFCVSEQHWVFHQIHLDDK